jgi:hypothetical protein
MNMKLQDNKLFRKYLLFQKILLGFLTLHILLTHK